MSLSMRQKINRSRLSKDERALREAGVTASSEYGPEGVLTETGRRIVLDILWEDKETRKKVIELVKKANAYEDDEE